jgi:hypothetical protein
MAKGEREYTMFLICLDWGGVFLSNRNSPMDRCKDIRRLQCFVLVSKETFVHLFASMHGSLRVIIDLTHPRARSIVTRKGVTHDPNNFRGKNVQSSVKKKKKKKARGC